MFDLDGTYLKFRDTATLKDIEISEQMGEFDEGFFEWAKGKWGNNREEIVETTLNFFDRLYEVREPDILEKFKGYKFGIGSNYISPMRNWLLEKELINKFEFAVISAEVMVAKPSADFYKNIITKSECRPEQIVFVDNTKENAEAAIKLGIKGVWYDEESKKSLSEALEDVLQDKK